MQLSIKMSIMISSHCCFDTNYLNMDIEFYIFLRYTFNIKWSRERYRIINGLHICMCYQSVERKGRYHVHEHNDILISTLVKLFPAGSLPADIFLSDLFSCRPLLTRTYASPVLPVGDSHVGRLGHLPVGLLPAFLFYVLLKS